MQTMDMWDTTIAQDITQVNATVTLVANETDLNPALAAAAQ